MERAAVGDGGVAVRTIETEPPVEQLTTQPPPVTPLQEAIVNATRTNRTAVEARRIGITPSLNSARPKT